MDTFIRVTSGNRSAARAMLAHYTTMQARVYVNLPVKKLGKALNMVIQQWESLGAVSEESLTRIIRDGLQFDYVKPGNPHPNAITIDQDLLMSGKKAKGSTTPPQPQPKKESTPMQSATTMTDKEKALQILLGGTDIDESQVNALIDAKISHLKPMPLGIELSINKKPVQASSEYHHEQFKDVLQALLCNEPVYLYGTASGGKTTMYKQLSASLSATHETNIPLYTSVQLFTQFEVTGYKDIKGDLVATIFKKWFQSGGLLAIDEFDRSMAKALTSLNQMIENRFFTFPDGERLEMHEHCYFIASGNTALNGNGSSAYNAAEAIDAATRDRFIAIEFKFDKHIESIMANGNDVWLDQVRRIRESAIELGIDIVVSTRPIRQGAKLLAQGVPLKQVIDYTIFKGLDKEQSVKILRAAKVGV